MLPQARIVVDKFHVVRMANDALERVRKGLRKELKPSQSRTLKGDRKILLKRAHEVSDRERLIMETWTGAFPQLLAAYEHKERFYHIWDCTNRRGAEQAAQAAHAQLGAADAQLVQRGAVAAQQPAVGRDEDRGGRRRPGPALHGDGAHEGACRREDLDPPVGGIRHVGLVAEHRDRGGIVELPRPAAEAAKGRHAPVGRDTDHAGMALVHEIGGLVRGDEEAAWAGEPAGRP